MAADTEDSGSDLEALLRQLSPRLHAGQYVYARVQGEVPAGVRPVVLVREDEGLTVVVPRKEADALRLRYGFVAAWITLEVNSSLDGLGLTAAFSRALAEAGVPCNVVAGFTHDHIFVPHDRADDAMAALESLSASSNA
jgi:hypothetical protein